MELYEAAYITCMLIVYVIRRAGSVSFEEKVKILQFISDLVLSLDTNLCSIYNCETKKALMYATE
jgi:hypothetical protein